MERFETRSIHAGQAPDDETGAVMPAIQLSTTFEQDAPGEDKGYEYARTGNPTRAALEANLASLEGGEFGRAFASGMAAIDAILHTLEAGDRVVAGNDVYGGTHRLLTQVYDRHDLETKFVDVTDLDALEAAMTPDTELLWLESPTNPLLSVVAIEAAAEIADEYDALCAVDNTFATPYLQRPLDHGADLVCHSLTKYLGGHSDVVGGAIVTDDEGLDDQFGFVQNAAGGTPGPFESFLVLRGTKTLPVRMDRHCENAAQLASWLENHDAADQVYYPGLDSHPGHEIAAEQMDDFGGMVSVEFDASLDETSELVAATEVFTLAESLGGVESLIEQPAAMTHAAIPREERIEAGLRDGLVRLSVGLEHVEDLQADLQQAIEAAIE
ncbi:cystathionine gamma-lyase [Salinarchaeum sp. Harcht-Bsk1]|uniref:cystathionine gamma-synthase n=1 Tax=Salinarchaeum sp. Harcht-Bsk1 TaxID=1333523 RepID=UPI00034246AF|nr:cystathionine gamma-synthase [Salinarchaeum sp. Harcht-Bsk1]AGN00236.1 cystathionine gamma-lyase [Salinarchaeum sp. Harcht-Bsk1]